MFVNALVGFKQADPDLIDLMWVSSESRPRIRFHIKLPAAGGTLLAGVEISVVLSLIGAVVGEFVAAERGMGTLLQKAATDLNLALMLATVFMPRQARLDIPGALHQIMVRGINKADIFKDDQDKTLFVERLGQNVIKGRGSVYAWVLMDNHLHLLFKSGQQSISAVMRKILTRPGRRPTISGPTGWLRR